MPAVDTSLPVTANVFSSQTGHSKSDPYNSASILTLPPDIFVHRRSGTITINNNHKYVRIFFILSYYFQFSNTQAADIRMKQHAHEKKSMNESAKKKIRALSVRNHYQFAPNVCVCFFISCIPKSIKMTHKSIFLVRI